MPALPLRGWILLGSLLAFAVAVLSVLAWAQFTGRAGSQRGLVIHNELDETATVWIAETDELRSTLAGGKRSITPDDEETFVVRRRQFPAFVSWSADGLVHEQLITYEYMADAEFRISIDEQGVYKTSEYRDTPVPLP